ncbi:MAG: YHS domain-containing protein [Bacteroidota bacterium]|nr:YHS domain-containing protein [Bacteroidota bacterium]
MKKRFILILVIAIGVSFSSCMMMMPGHMSGSMQNGHHHDSSITNIDQVCGKQVMAENSLTYEYQGNAYYFDSEQCLSVFKSNPDHFVQKHHKDTPNKTLTTVGWIGGGVAMTALMILMMSSVF